MLIPIKEHILIELKQSSLITGEAGVGHYQEGDVVAIGDEVVYASVGDHVLWQQYSESNIFERDGKKLTLVKEEHLMAKESNGN